MKSVQEILETAYKLTMEHLRNRSHVGQLLSPTTLKEKLNLSLNETGSDSAELKKEMENFLEFSANTLTPQFQNQLFSGLNPYALAGDWLSTIVNTTMSTYEASPVGTLVEKELVSHMNKFAGWTDGDGIMVTGGSNANLVAMLLGRNHLYPESKVHGNHKKFSAFVSEESHYSFDKAINLMGLGTRHLIKVPADASGKMIPEKLTELIKASVARGETPFFVAATAGTTVIGAFDPIREISRIAREHKMWLHVDGAWGGSSLLSKTHRHLLDGVELADSLTWDTHKMLGTGLISSFILTKHKGILRSSNDSGNADYLFHENENSAWDMGPSSLQCGRRIDSFKVWLMWKALGDQGLEKLVDSLFAKANDAREMISQSEDLELIHHAQMLNICFRFKNRMDSSETVVKVRKLLLAEGQHFVNYSTRNGENFFRMIIANPELKREQTLDFLNRVVELSK